MPAVFFGSIFLIELGTCCSFKQDIIKNAASDSTDAFDDE